MGLVYGTHNVASNSIAGKGVWIALTNRSSLRIRFPISLRAALSTDKQWPSNGSHTLCSNNRLGRNSCIHEYPDRKLQTETLRSNSPPPPLSFFSSRTLLAPRGVALGFRPRRNPPPIPDPPSTRAALLPRFDLWSLARQPVRGRVGLLLAPRNGVAAGGGGPSDGFERFVLRFRV
ncbi:hypothetical protein BHE74_00020911 [Ensete ventricosum]|nr:hypothetical protein BHE74_00020911 [Ensete ventricosum]